MELDHGQLFKLIISAAIHDVGALSVQERDLLIMEDVQNPRPHCDMGCKMLSSFAPFAEVARVIKHHHIRYASAQDIAIALRVDEIDCGIATESAARVNGLDFVPLTDECFDLVMRRGSYFEPGPQKLMAYIRGTQFTRQANALSGYDISHAGLVRLNK